MNAVDAATRRAQLHTIARAYVTEGLAKKNFGSLVLPGFHNYLISGANKEYPYRSNWILWKKCVTFKIP